MTSKSKEIDKLTDQFDQFDKQVKDLAAKPVDLSDSQPTEMKAKMSQKEISDTSNDIYLKPRYSIGSREKFNESFRDDYEFSKEYVRFIAENKETAGERIEMWTKAFPGVPVEFWEIPPGKTVVAPRYVAEQIKQMKYRRLRMNESTVTGSDSMGTYSGALVADTIVQRADAYPATSRKSVFVSE